MPNVWTALQGAMMIASSASRPQTAEQSAPSGRRIERRQQPNGHRVLQAADAKRE